MHTSEQINELAAALAAAQGEIKNATLNKINPHFKAKYADLAQIRDTVAAPLSKAGLSIVQGFSLLDGKPCFTTRLMHKSGQWIESTLPFAGDLANPQKAGSAITYYRRYCLAAMAGIAAEEDDDANAAAERKNGNGHAPEPDPDKYVEGALAVIKEEPSLEFCLVWWKDQAENRRKNGLTQGHVDVLKRAIAERFPEATQSKEAA